MSSPRPCSIAAALAVVGEKYSLLVLREVFYGVRRFDGMVRNIGAPRDILTARLRKLVDAGVLERVQYSERPPRYEYHATEAGLELRGVLHLLRQWGDRHLMETPPVMFEHSCGADLETVPTCRSCGAEPAVGELSARFASPEWTTEGRATT